MSPAMSALVTDIRKAFSNRAMPDRDNITRCSYDKKYGGAYDGPCLECSRMAEFFGSKQWFDISVRELRREGDAASLFTREAYCYFLPAYLIAALTDPDEADVLVDGLEFQFGRKPEDDWGYFHWLSEILALLTHDELKVCQRYFKRAQGDDFDNCRARAITNIRCELDRRVGKQPA